MLSIIAHLLTRVLTRGEAAAVSDLVLLFRCRITVSVPLENLDHAIERHLGGFRVIYQGDADKGSPRVAQFGILGTHVGAGQNLDAGFPPEAFCGLDAVADIEPEKESRRRV